jgi:hypothetical protein
MALFPSSSVDALPSDFSPGGKTFFKHAVRIEFPKAAQPKAPWLLNQLICEIQRSDATLKVFDHTDAFLDLADFPTTKEAFDARFSPVITGSHRNPSMKITLTLQSSEYFGQIKKIGMAILKKHQFYFKKHPGPIQKVNLVPIGMFLDIHPRTSSHSSANALIIGHLHADFDSLAPEVKQRLNLTSAETTTMPDFFFGPEKLTGTFNNEKIESEGILVYCEKHDIDKYMLWFTEWYSPQDNRRWFVPLSVKRSNPSLWGNMLNRQNSFLSSHRNISIIGVSTNVMDYCDPTSDDGMLTSSLWQEIWEHPGIDAVFGHIRTPDLGKWNISTSDNHYPEVCAWLDQHLPAKFSMIPTNVAQKVTFEDFAQPERLSRNRTDGSVVSGLTTRSDTTAYSNRLLATFGTSKDTQPAPNAWRPPPTVDSVNYHFDPKDFPKPETTADTATAPSVTAPTVISDVTHSLISQSVASSIAEWEAKHIARELQAQDKLTSLQLDIQKLSQSVAADVTRQVLAAIDSHPGTTQAITKSDMDNNLAPIIQALNELTLSIKAIQDNNNNTNNDPNISPGRSSPSSKTIRATQEGPSIPSNGSPDRKKIKNGTEPMEADYAVSVVGHK